jgi:hypothetical protein
VVLRLSLLINYDTWQSYDALKHWWYVTWYHDHYELPPVDVIVEAYHPPLWYFMSGMLTRISMRGQGLQVIAVGCGCARLVLVWMGIERWLPGGAVARRVALGLAAVLPASVFLEGMMGAEPLSNLLAAAILVLSPAVFAVEGKQRLGRAAVLGLLAGLALLTKISALSLIGAIGLGALFECATREGSARVRLARLAPFFAGLAVCALTSGFYFGHNVRTKGKPFLSSFDWTQQNLLAKVKDIPYLSRRPIGYLLGWSIDPHVQPLWPAGGPPQPRFWPMLIATTFVDYYNYGYAAQPERGESFGVINNRPIKPWLVIPSMISFNCGVLIALMTMIAWVMALVAVIRARQAARLVLLLVPFMATVGAVHFAWAYPFDDEGIIKGAYLQFAAPPLCGLFGLAAERLWRRKVVWVFPLLALGGVAMYSLICRVLTY